MKLGIMPALMIIVNVIMARKAVLPNRRFLDRAYAVQIVQNMLMAVPTKVRITVFFSAMKIGVVFITCT